MNSWKIGWAKPSFIYWHCENSFSCRELRQNGHRTGAEMCIKKLPQSWKWLKWLTLDDDEKAAPSCSFYNRLRRYTPSYCVVNTWLTILITFHGKIILQCSDKNGHSPPNQSCDWNSHWINRRPPSTEDFWENAFPPTSNRQSYGTIRKCSSRAFQWMVMLHCQ
jgi:hypothetical protein